MIDNKLTSREKQVLAVLLQGRSNREISEELELSVNTIKSHLKRIYTKREVKTRTELIIKAQAYRDSQNQ